MGTAAFIKQELREEKDRQKYTTLLTRVENLSKINELIEKLLHDMQDLGDTVNKHSKTRTSQITDLIKQNENLKNIFGMESENKTSQISSLLEQIKRNSDDLLNLQVKIENITTSLDRLDDIKKHLLEESERMVLNTENVLEQNDATRQYLQNVSQTYFSRFSIQLNKESKNITKSVKRVLESIDVMEDYVGGSCINRYYYQINC